MSDAKKLTFGFLTLVSLVLLIAGIANGVIGMIILGAILTTFLLYIILKKNPPQEDTEETDEEEDE